MDLLSLADMFLEGSQFRILICLPLKKWQKKAVILSLICMKLETVSVSETMKQLLQSFPSLKQKKNGRKRFVKHLFCMTGSVSENAKQLLHPN